MASYETAAAEEGLLLETPKPKPYSLKGLVACAAIASFVLGMVAATAVTQHAIARQTSLKTTAAGMVEKAYNTPANEENCGGQWGFALAFGRKDAKNQCPPGESASPPLSLSLSLCVSAYTQSRQSLFGAQVPSATKPATPACPACPKLRGCPGWWGASQIR